MAKGGTPGKPGGDTGGDTGGDGTSGYTTWVWFGDSLVDDGNFYTLASQILIDPFPLASAGYTDAFTDGDVFAEVAMSLFGVADADYHNHAYGSAQAIGEQTVADIIDARSPVTAYDVDDGEAFDYDPIRADYDGSLDSIDINLGGQVDAFLAANPTVADGTTATLMIGANDLAGFDPSYWDIIFGDPVGDLADDVAGEIYDQAERLVVAGVDRIVLNTLPVAEFFPVYDLGTDTEQGFGRDLVDQTNANILGYVDDLEALGAVVEVVRYDYLGEQVETEGETFGLLEVNEPMVFGSGGDAIYEGDADAGTATPYFPENPFFEESGLTDDQIAFKDYIHPSAALHGVMGIFFYESLTSETLLLGDDGQNRRLGNGDDMVFGAGGFDRLQLRRGDDVAFGGAGNDTIHGEGGSDLIAGGSGNDTLSGGEQNDLLAGGLGDDAVFGDAGDDILISGRGAETLDGGTGNDAFIYRADMFLGGSTIEPDLFLGGGGVDTTFLLIDADDRAAAEGAWGAGAGGTVAFDFGLTLEGIENVQFFVERADFDNALASAFTGDMADRFHEADLWGLV